MTNEKKTVTFLTGSGFTSSSQFMGISTQNLTDKIRKLHIPGYEIKNQTPGEYLYRLLCYHYTRKTVKDCDISIVNFETIIHLLEEMYTFFVSQNKDGIAKKDPNVVKNLALHKGVKPSFLEIRDDVLKEIDKIRKRNRIKYRNQVVRVIYSYFIQELINNLKSFNSDKDNAGMRGFVSNYLGTNFPESKYVRRFYTLNYDTWLNRYLGFYDGFDNDGKFQSNEVMSNDKIDCHYNLHGSLLWANTLDVSNVEKRIRAVDYLSYSKSSNYSINREPLIATPIITGYNKMQRMKYAPYLELYYSLQKDILSSDLLVIIGYSSSDTHVNSILSLYKGKAVVVNFIWDWFEAEIKAKKHKLPQDELDPAYDIFDIEKTVFENIEPFDNGFNLNLTQIAKGFVKSKNGNTRVWWRGIGEEFYTNWSKIISQ
jgi:hypothetical protein